MRSSTIAIGVLIGWLAAGGAGAGPPADGVGARATLPLEELLALRRELDERRRQPDPAPPPVAATLDSVELSGRLVEESLELGTKVAVTVLRKGWVSVPLLRLAPGLQVTSRPALEGATLAVKDGWLALVTEQPGCYRFELGLQARAPEAAGAHRLELEPAQATVAALHVQYDERLYRVEGSLARESD